MSTRTELVRFGAVGLLQNGVNLGIFAVMVAAQVAYQLAAAVAAVAALLVSFVLNRSFTFSGSSGGIHEHLWRYVVVFVASIAGGLGVLTMAVEFLGVTKIVGQLIAIIAVAPMSYFAQKHWTFDRQRPAGDLNQRRGVRSLEETDLASRR